MALTAIRAADGAEIESFELDAAEWEGLKGKPLGTYRMPDADWPAVPKTSPLGLQFFAYGPGYNGEKRAPESIEHQMAKLTIVKALRAAGFEAWAERSGETPKGERWWADVLFDACGHKIAVEIQLSKQTFREYELRTQRYQQSGLEVIWLIRESHYASTSKDFARKLLKAGVPIGKLPSIFSHRPAALLSLLPVERGTLDPSSQEIRIPVNNELAPTRMPLERFIVGAAEGKLEYTHRWCWRE